MSCDVALIEPPGRSGKTRIPFALLCLASYLQKVAGVYDVKIIDIKTDIFKKKVDAENEELARKIIKETIKLKPSIVGLPCLVTDLKYDMRIARELKEKLPDTIFVVGGIHATLYPEDVLFEGTPFDYLVYGEGEVTFGELVNAVRNKKPVDKILGLAWFNKKIIRTSPRPLMEDIDIIYPLPYDLIDMKYYGKPDQSKLRYVLFSSINFFTSRGCPFQCTFCVAKNLWKDVKCGKILRFRSVDNVLDEIELLIKDYKFDAVRFHDETFTLKKKRTEEFCKKIIKRNLKFTWSCETRVDCITKDLLKLMKKAGCFQIAFGIESGSQERIDFMKKDIKIEQVREAFKMCHEIDIRAFGCFMFNTPEETLEDVKKSIALIEELNACWYNIAICTPLPGADIYSYVKPKLKIEEYDKFENAVIELTEPRFRMASHNLDITKLVKGLKKKYDNNFKRMLNIFPIFSNRAYFRQFVRSKRKLQYFQEILHIFVILFQRRLVRL